MLLIKIIKLIKLILLKLIIRLDEALIEANLQAKAGRDEHNQGYNANRRVNGAISTDVLNEHKAVTGQAKAKLANRRAKRAIKGKVRKGRGENKFGDKDKATIENENKDKRGDNNKSRKEYNFRLWEITKSYRGSGAGSTARLTSPSTSSLTFLMFQISSIMFQLHPIHHSYVPNLILLIGIFIFIFIIICFIIFFIISNNISTYTYSRKLSTRTSSIKHHIISFIFSPHGMSHISIEIWRKGRGDI